MLKDNVFVRLGDVFVSSVRPTATPDSTAAADPGRGHHRWGAGKLKSGKRGGIWARLAANPEL